MIANAEKYLYWKTNPEWYDYDNNEQPYLTEKAPEKAQESFKNYLYTKDLPDVDLMIRTSNEQRISNFLLYQLAYSELIFMDTYWPDFKKEDLDKAIEIYNSRNRRFGGLDETKSN